MKYPELKAGMLIELSNKDKYLIIPQEDEVLVGMCLTGDYWASVPSALFESVGKYIVKVGYPLTYFGNSKLLFKNVIWERPKEFTVTMQEIADKFGIPISQLKIRK